MAVNDFVWCDLSALRVEKAVAFYGAVLGWTFDPPSEDYRNAYDGEEAVAALFDMPAFFRKINMPSFWMSYIRVVSIAEVVEVAREQGGKVELEDDFGDGRIALIRDPLGAGFTIYEGAMPAGARGLTRQGLRAGHALHVSSQAAVEPFYRALFGWTMICEVQGHWTIANAQGQRIADLYQSEDAQRGGFEYWGIAFTVADLGAARRTIKAQGGAVFAEMPLVEGPALCASDADGAAFFAVEGMRAA